MVSKRVLSIKKKLRGVPRRLRALNSWSESMRGFFPKDIDGGDNYFNLKIPVMLSLVEGRQTNLKIKKECAQILINAAYEIFKAKPDDFKDFRVTCCVVLPNMFSSEVCIYCSEDYFNQHTQPGSGFFGDISLITDKSLSSCWGLVLPEGFSELGVIRYSEGDDGNYFSSECWYFGEVGNR